MRAIEIKRLSYSYPGEEAVLRNVTFTVEEGERVGLIGPNGAGKSTLLMHLNGLLPEKLDPSPAVSIQGVPVQESSLAAVRTYVGLLFQNPDDQLFCSTVGEDVAFGPKQLKLSQREVESRVMQSILQVGLEGMEGRNPFHLSRGEKQRACLAGLLACDCRILALDEPTSNLDPRGRRELRELLKKLPQTQLIASHDLEFVIETCSRVVLLDAGRVVADGPTDMILSDEALMLKHGLERPHILTHMHPHGAQFKKEVV